MGKNGRILFDRRKPTAEEVCKLRKAATGFVMSVCPAATGRIFMKFGVLLFFENLSRKVMFNYNMTTTTGTLQADQYTFSIIPRSVLLRVRNIFDKSCRGNQNTHFVFRNNFSKF
jgi:hypothetical protein